MTAPRAREQSDPPAPPDRRPPRRGGGFSPSTYAASAGGGLRGLLRPARRTALAAAGLAGVVLAAGLALAPPAQAQTATEIWSATLSPGDSGSSSGYFDFGAGFVEGELTDDDFTFAGTDYTIKQTYTGTFDATFLYLQTNPRMTSTSAARQDLVFIVDGTRFALSDASDPGNIGNWRWRNPGFTFTEGTDVDLSLEGIVRPRPTAFNVRGSGNKLWLFVNENLSNILPPTSAFTLTAAGSPVTIGSISLQTNLRTLDLTDFSP